MSSKTLFKLIRSTVIVAVFSGLFAYIYIIPTLGTYLVNQYPDYAHLYYPWLIFLWIAALPYLAVLVLMWRVSGFIGQDKVFTTGTAKIAKVGSILFFGNAGFFLLGNVVFLVLNMNHPIVLLLSFFICMFNVTLAVFAAVVARYITKAATLQEEADNTI